MRRYKVPTSTSLHVSVDSRRLLFLLLEKLHSLSGASSKDLQEQLKASGGEGVDVRDR